MPKSKRFVPDPSQFALDELKTYWDRVKAATADAANSYAEFVAASDKLADVPKYDPDYVLGKLLPNARTATRDRRLPARLVKVISDQQEKIMDHYMVRELERRHREARRALMDRLKLSEADMELLGIT